MADPQIGDPATSRATPRERVLGVVLLCLFLGLALLLVGACNIDGFPPPPPRGDPGGGGGLSQQGAGGTGVTRDGGGPAPGGAGGQGGNTGCLTHSSMTCVVSCAISVPSIAFGSCDQNGSLTCPAGYLPLASCAPNACAQSPNFSCCNQTTGAITQPPCGTEGLIVDCPMGTLQEKLYVCIPPSLGVTNCASLVGQPCDLLDMRCESDIGTLCACEPGDAGFIWSCLRFGDPPP